MSAAPAHPRKAEVRTWPWLGPLIVVAVTAWLALIGLCTVIKWFF